MTAITAIDAEEIQDSRGKPTIRVIVAAGDAWGDFSVPSGASVGSGEAVEIRDDDGGMKGVISNIAKMIAPALIGMDASDQRAIDQRLLEIDGTQDKSKLGGNACIGVSIANARAAAASRGVPLHLHIRSLADIRPSRDVPYLFSNYINGGKHADSPLVIQEHMIVPESESVRGAIRMIERVAEELEQLIREKYGDAAASSAGDEGGFVIPDGEPDAGLLLLAKAAEHAGLGDRVQFALDAAATSFWKDGSYTMGGRAFSPGELSALYKELSSRYPILSIEDPFEEHAHADFSALQRDIGSVRIVGDDLTVTNAAMISAAAGAGEIRAVIIKPNQIGTLTETLDAMKAARDNNVDCIVSHRSGETMDAFVADLAAATGAFGLKAGAFRKKERKVKYDRLAELLP